MRPLILATATLAGLAVVLANRPSPAAPAQPAAGDTVKVHVTCQGSQVSFWVNPWTVTISRGDSVVWQLETGSTADEISVAQKQGQWPFAGPPQAGNRSRPAKSGGPANRVGRHGYSITLQCADNGPRVIVDPDIVIN